MKIKIEPPSAFDYSQLNVADEAIEIIPQTVKSQSTIKVGYVTATGDGGMESKAIIVFNTSNGEFAIRNTLDKSKANFDFDLPVAEFKKKREAKKKKNDTSKNPAQAGQ